MENCIFCKIASHEIPKKPEELLYEDDRVMAFFDIHPKAPGHTIVIPKEHSRWFHEMPDNLSGHLFNAAKEVAKKLGTEHGTEFIRFSIMGDEVPHTHIHLIPQRLS